MGTGKAGPDLVAVALANTFASYLPAEIAVVNAAWNDANTVPPLVNPKVYFSERRILEPESPTLMIGMNPAQQTANGANNANAGWAPISYHFDAMLFFRGDALHILERWGRRYAQAMWEVVMKHQHLDEGGAGEIPGQVGVDLMNWTPEAFNSPNTRLLSYVVTWSGVVYVLQDV